MNWLSDLLIGLRRMGRSGAPGLVVVTTIATAIGLGIAIYSVNRAVLLRPLPYPSPERLLMVQTEWPGSAVPGPVRASHYSAWCRGREVDGVAALRVGGMARYSLSTPEGYLPVEAVAVTRNLFAVLDAPMALGRSFSNGEHSDGGGAEVVLSHRAWRTMFASDGHIAGRTIRIWDGANERLMTIVGVLGPEVEVRYPEGFDFYLPLALDASTPNPRLPLTVTAHLAQQASASSAIAELTALADSDDRRLGLETVRLRVTELHEYFFGWTRRYLLVLNLTAALAVGIALINVAEISTVIGQRRWPETTVRLMLGASRLRLAWQMAAENLWLGMIGSLFGLLLAAPVTHGLMLLIRNRMPRIADLAEGRVGVSAFVLLFLVVILVFSVVPALRLAYSGRLARSETPLTVRRAPRLLIAIQAALLFMLATDASLAIRSLWNLEHVNYGFEPKDIVVVELARSTQSSRVFTAQVRADLTARLKGLPGIAEAAIGQRAPFAYVSPSPTTVRGDAEAKDARVEAVGEGYLQLLRLPLRSGRFAREEEDAVLVNERFVRDRLAGADPLGREVSFMGQAHPIVGVVADTYEIVPEPGPPTVAAQSAGAVPTVYCPLTGSAARSSLLLRHDGRDAGAVVRSVRAAVEATGLGLVVGRGQPLEERIRSASVDIRSYSWSVIVLTGCSLALCLLGVYGLSAHEALSRAREMAVRITIGATTQSILLLATGRTVLWVLAGVLPGLALAWGSRRLLEAYLFQVGATDAGSLVVAAAVLAAAAAIGTAGPAWRCARIDPVVTLRSE